MEDIDIPFSFFESLEGWEPMDLPVSLPTTPAATEEMHTDTSFIFEEFPEQETVLHVTSSLGSEQETPKSLLEPTVEGEIENHIVAMQT